MIYINRFSPDFGRETVEEYENSERGEAQRELVEYRVSDPDGHYYLSQRCCKHWEDE